jgi:hypothetical protein
VVTDGVDKLEDGAQVVIGREEEVGSATAPGVVAAKSAAGTQPTSMPGAAGNGQQRGRRKRPAQ